MVFYIAQGFGFIGLVMVAASFQQKTQKKILFFQMLAGFAFIIHFMMLGAYTGAALNFLGAIRSIVFSFKEKSKIIRSPFCPILFMALFAVVGILTWEGPLSILPTAAMVLLSLSFWLTNPRMTRMLTLPGSPMWFVYDVFNNSWTGMITEVFATSSMIIAIVRYDIIPAIRKRKEKKIPASLPRIVITK